MPGIIYDVCFEKDHFCDLFYHANKINQNVSPQNHKKQVKRLFIIHNAE